MRPLAICLSAILLFACAATQEEQVCKDFARPLAPGAKALVPVDPSQWPDFYAGIDPAGDPGHRKKLLEAIDHSISWFQAPSSTTHFPYDGAEATPGGISHDRIAASLASFRELVASRPSREEFRRQLEANFVVYTSVGWDGGGDVLFTAYCEPIYQGSKTRSSRFRYPLYGLPEDLVKAPDGKPLGRKVGGAVQPCPTRREIEKGDWVKGKEVVWLADRFDAYVVHVQGSARIQLAEGGEMRIGYAGKTDRPYVSVGKELVKDGKIPEKEMSLKAIRNFFKTNPAAMDDYLDRNESFVFFLERDGGPYGSLGVPVTSGCSIATDKSVFPRGSIAFLDTTLPIDPSAKVFQPHKAFVLDQDTGGAIRSAGRTDIFLGTGPSAEERAGHVQQEGRLYYLFLKDDRALASAR